MKNIMEQHKQVPKERRTFIASNLVRESVMLDAFGNEIDPITKQIIKKNNEKENE